jgi:2-polyprenyl-3-methyl-5-hydroxy-6-metoxy-1,4-benzoquinol methylase
VKPGRLRAVAPKSTSEIASEWDVLASERLDQITVGLDVSFDHVVVPSLLAMVDSGSRRALDIGCGVGALTARLADRVDEVVGVDASLASIQLARKSNDRPNVTYDSSSVEDFALRFKEGAFDLIVANMTLMDVPDLHAVALASSRLLQQGGQFLFSITHPWFWPRYWGYEGEPWFDYNAEIFIEAQFSISRARSAHISTHVHRPLHAYFNILAGVGIATVSIEEPVPTPDVAKFYPEPWRFPRFLIAAAEKRGKLGGSS